VQPVLGHVNVGLPFILIGRLMNPTKMPCELFILENCIKSLIPSTAFTEFIYIIYLVHEYHIMFSMIKKTRLEEYEC